MAYGIEMLGIQFSSVWLKKSDGLQDDSFYATKWPIKDRMGKFHLGIKWV